MTTCCVPLAVNAFTRRSPAAVAFSWQAKTFTVVLELAHFAVTMLMSVGNGASPFSSLSSLSSLSSEDGGGGGSGEGEEGEEGSCDYPFSLWFRTATVSNTTHMYCHLSYALHCSAADPSPSVRTDTDCMHLPT